MPKTKKPRGDEIKINNVDFLEEKTQEDHHTDEFESEKHLVLRRGGNFEFLVEFSRPLSGDQVEIEFHRGYRTSFRRGNRFVAELGVEPEHPHQLKLTEVESDGPKVKFSIPLPPDFPVGGYRVVVEVSPEHSRTRSKFEYGREVVILFNPWCKDDGVFMNDDSKRCEYVLNENGKIWAGTHDDMFTWPWNYAQFETSSLEAVLYMLDMFDGIDSDGRRDPIQVTRALVEMVNQDNNDGGILTGLWSPNDEDYEDGTDPTAWSGSSAIIEEYMASKKAVKYGQCWVFGATLTTVLRTVGIPARPVTNFESAHDADSNRAIDYYYDLEDQMVEEKSGDSIWNYHVWAEAWMSRPDLGPTYGGWQAVDATPQEVSPHSNTYVVGPASVASIKDGQDLPFDSEFVISEVNADIKYYYEVEKDKFEMSGANVTKVGQNISTKAVGSNTREDVTSSYKYTEGTVAERAALKAGDEEMKASDVDLTVEFSRRATIGEGFVVVVKAKNFAKDVRVVRVRAIVHTVTYTGVASKVVKKFKDCIRLSGRASSQCTFPVSAEDYLDILGDQALLSVTVLSLVEETGQSGVTKVSYRLRRPDLALVVDGKKVSGDVPIEVTGGQEYTVTASFTNPLVKPMTNVVFYIEGARVVKAQKIEGKTTAPGKVAEISFQISPRKPRKNPYERSLVVTCQSKELKGTMGTAVAKVNL